MTRSLALLTVLVFTALMSLALWLAVDRLRLDTGTDDLISSEAAYLQRQRQFEETFPQASAPLVLVIQGQTPERSRWSADRLAQRLSQRDDLVQEVHQPRGGEFFDRHALLYLSVDQLERLSNRLAEAQPFLGRLVADPTAHGLSAVLVEALERDIDAPKSAMVSLLEQMRETIPADEAEPARELSWRRLVDPTDDNSAQTLHVVQVWPAHRDAEAVPTGHAIDAIHQSTKSLELNAHGVSVRVTGKAALAHDELTTTMQGLRVSGPLSVILVAGLLLYAMRSHALMIGSLLTLAAGLLLTLGFATLAVGRLNLISIAFGVLYVGLGADFAIHLSLNIRALRAEGLAPTAALRGAVRDVAGSLGLCTLTTMMGFLAFLPTSFVAVAELGLIAGAGMAINLVTTLALLPALMTLLPSRWRRPPSPTTSPTLLAMLHAPERHRAPVLTLAVAVALLGAALAPNIRFDSDPLNLRDPDSTSVQALRDLRQEHSSDHWSVSAVAGSAEAAATLSERLANLPLVDHVVWLGSFAPQRQSEKLAMIDDLALLLGPTLQSPTNDAGETGAKETLQALKDLADQLRRSAEDPQTEPALASAAGNLSEALQDWLSRVDRSQPPQVQLDRLQRAWLGAFPLMIERLSESLGPAGPITLDTLPESLSRRWVSRSGLHRIEAFPRTNLSEQGAMRRFVAQVRSVTSGVVGASVSQLEAGEIVVRAFILALSLATAAIVLIALIAFRSAVTMLEVLTPLVIGGLATIGAMVLLNEPFNFANVIALPLLFGVGVDSGIHLVHRSKQGTHDRLLQSATARGVLFSGLTTIAGFGSLAFSPHPGMASMGLVLSVGMAAILLSTLVALPALLTFRAPARSNRSAQATRSRP